MSGARPPAAAGRSAVATRTRARSRSARRFLHGDEKRSRRKAPLRSATKTMPRTSGSPAPKRRDLSSKVTRGSPEGEKTLADVLAGDPRAGARHDRVGGGASEKEPLAPRDAKAAEAFQLVARLDALGDQLGVDALAERRERTHDLALDPVLVEARDERVSHFHVLRPELHDGLEARVARARVVDREPEAGRPEPPDDLAKRRVIEDDLFLRKLENDVPVHAAHLGEIAVVEKHRVREKPRRGVHEQTLFSRDSRERREDRLDAKALPPPGGGGPPPPPGGAHPGVAAGGPA